MHFTGERYLPHLLSAKISYEHWHRYLYASAFVKEKTVLDIACGEGYGTSFLAQSAKTVHGIDIDKDIIQHACQTYVSPNLHFHVGPVNRIAFPDQHFDVVVSFETIEHVDEATQIQFLNETKRILRPEGLFIVSTPDRGAYSDRPGYNNPFHRKELYIPDFTSMLRSHFKQVILLGQNVLAMSYIWAEGQDPSAFCEYGITSSGNGFKPAAPIKPLLYAIGLCSDAAIPYANSLLVDQQNTLLTEEERTRRGLESQAQQQEAKITGLEGTLAAITATLSRYDASPDELSTFLASLSAERAELTRRYRTAKAAWRLLGRKLGAARGAVESLRKDLSMATSAQQQVQEELVAAYAAKKLIEGQLREEIAQISNTRDQLQAKLDQMLNSRSWQLTAPLRTVLSVYSKAASRRQSPRHQQSLALHAPTGPGTQDGAASEHPPSVLIIDHHVPTPDRDSGSVRMFAIITLWRDLGYRVSFLPDDLRKPSSYTSDLEAIGVEVLGMPEVTNVDDYLQRVGNDFDIITVCRVDVAHKYMWTLKHGCPHAFVVFDTVDLHYLREQRRAQVEADPVRAIQARKVKEIELATACQANVTLVVSEPERQELLGENPALDVRVLSNIHSVQQLSAPWADRRDLFFLGGFRHAPNVDAAIYLVRNVMPRVWQELPDVRLFLVGDSPSREVLNLASHNVTVTGHAPDLTIYLHHSRVSVAPLRYGAGVKGKITLSMGAGVPVVATSLAIEGMHLQDQVDVLVADTSEGLACATVQLYSNEGLWAKLSAAGQQNVAEHYSLTAAKQVLLGLHLIARGQTLLTSLS